MNKRGAGMFFAIMVAIMIWIFGYMAIQFYNYDNISVTDSNNLDCNNVTISDGNKGLCLLTDITFPYALLILLSAAGGIITSQLNI